MTVQKMVRTRARRRSIKAQRPWSRTVRSYFTKPTLDRTFASVRPSMGVFGFSQSYRTKLRYVDIAQITSTAGSTAKVTFSPQSCFDPNVTATGHQPMYFDQLAAVYARYKVHGATIRVTFNPNTTTAGAVQAFGIIGGSSTTIAGDAPTNMEDNHGVSSTTNGPNGIGQKTLYLTYQPKRDLGISVDDDTLVTATNTGPSTYFWNVWFNELGIAGSSSMIVFTEIFFDVEFVDNINISGS